MKRNLYLTTRPVEEARDTYMEALGDAGGPKQEKVKVIDALDRVTFEAVYAIYSSPLYNSAAMDGIAVISSRTVGASESAPVIASMAPSFSGQYRFARPIRTDINTAQALPWGTP